VNPVLVKENFMSSRLGLTSSPSLCIVTIEAEAKHNGVNVKAPAGYEKLPDPPAFVPNKKLLQNYTKLELVVIVSLANVQSINCLFTL